MDGTPKKKGENGIVPSFWNFVQVIARHANVCFEKSKLGDKDENFQIYRCKFVSVW